MMMMEKNDINHENVLQMEQEANQKTLTNLAQCINIFSRIKWKRVTFNIMMRPEPSHRPRLCGYRVYVPGAAKNQAFFNKKVLPTLKGLFITTPCRFDVDIYCETPKSFTKLQKLLAEMKILRPWGNIGDVDNYAKAVYDMCTKNETRGFDGIIINDCLVVESKLRKFYSKTPRYEIIIEFMDKIPKELLSVLRLMNTI
jgi:Holliday junction resolvase RusA-like endonuclease